MAEAGHPNDSGSDYVFDLFCELCIEGGSREEAHGYCMNCEEYLCSVCINAHKRTRSTRHHELNDKASMPKSKPLSKDTPLVSSRISTMCASHRTEPVSFYCKSHAFLGCSICFTTTHRTCPNTETVLDNSKSITDSLEYKDFVKTIEMLKLKSEEMLSRARENFSLAKNLCSDVVNSVREVKERVILALNEFERSIVEQAEKLSVEKENQFRTIDKECSDLSKRMDELKFDFERLPSSKRACQIYINMKESESEVKASEERLNKIGTINTMSPFTFEVNDDLLTCLEGPDILGKISFQHQKTATGPLVAASKDPSTTTATYLKEINISSSTDRRNYINGMTLLSGSRLVITDSNNAKVKLVDLNSDKLLTERSLSCQPWDVTVVNRNLLAVTLPEEKKIVLLTTDTLTLDREKYTSGTCYGLAHTRNNLVVSFRKNPRLEIIDLRGNLVRTIEYDRDGCKLFKFPWCLCVSNDGDTIYVSDNDHFTVTGLALDGAMKSVYKDIDLIRPQGICTDHLGNVYVCAPNCRNVHMLTDKCKKVKIILTDKDGISVHCWTLGHCRDTNRLFVGADCEVKVFNLS